MKRYPLIPVPQAIELGDDGLGSGNDPRGRNGEEDADREDGGGDCDGDTMLGHDLRPPGLAEFFEAPCDEGRVPVTQRCGSGGRIEPQLDRPRERP